MKLIADIVLEPPEKRVKFNKAGPVAKPKGNNAYFDPLIGDRVTIYSNKLAEYFRGTVINKEYEGYYSLYHVRVMTDWEVWVDEVWPEDYNEED